MSIPLWNWQPGINLSRMWGSKVTITKIFYGLHLRKSMDLIFPFISMGRLHVTGGELIFWPKKFLYPVRTLENISRNLSLMQEILWQDSTTNCPMCTRQSSNSNLRWLNSQFTDNTSEATGLRKIPITWKVQKQFKKEYTTPLTINSSLLTY